MALTQTRNQRPEWHPRLCTLWVSGGSDLRETAVDRRCAPPAVGSHPYTLTVNDGHGGTASDVVVVTVQDTTSPVVTVTAPRGLTVPTAAPLTIVWTA